MTYSELPSGSFFTFPGLPNRELFKTTVCAITEKWKMLIVRDDAPVIRSDDGQKTEGLEGV